MYEETWREWAACNGLDVDLFYPEKSQNAKRAKQVCDSCPVRTECLVWALRHRERFGIWGGKTTNERSRMLRYLRKAGSVLVA